MKAAQASFEVRTAVPGELVVHVVDASANVKTFEHDSTRHICGELRARGVTLTKTSPHLAMSVKDFSDAFAGDDNWNVLLLVSHGRRQSDKADYLRLAEVRAHWFLANGVDMHVADIAVFLCVCEGACEDATFVLLREQLALILTAPTEKLSRQEAADFFPNAIAELKGKEEITPEDVRAAAEKHADAAHKKMKVLSAVGFA